MQRCSQWKIMGRLHFPAPENSDSDKTVMKNIHYLIKVAVYESHSINLDILGNQMGISRSQRVPAGYTPDNKDKAKLKTVLTLSIHTCIQTQHLIDKSHIHYK